MSVLILAAGCSRLAPGQALLPPHSANRHDAGCRGAGADRVVDQIVFGQRPEFLGKS